MIGGAETGHVLRCRADVTDEHQPQPVMQDASEDQPFTGCVALAHRGEGARNDRRCALFCANELKEVARLSGAHTPVGPQFGAAVAAVRIGGLFPGDGILQPAADLGLTVGKGEHPLPRDAR